MRHNLFVLVKTLRTGALPRARRLIGLLAAVSGAVLPRWAAIGAPVAAAAAPTLTNPGEPGPSEAGQAIAPLKISGTEIEGVTEAGLPEGLAAKVASPSEVEITGTPTKTKSRTWSCTRRTKKANPNRSNSNGRS